VITNVGKLGLRSLESLILVVVLVALWQWYTQANHPLYFTTPAGIWTDLRAHWFTGTPNKLRTALEPSIRRVAIGWLIAAVVGIGLGVAIGASRKLAPYVDPLVHFLRSLPPPAILPIFLVLFGIGDRMKIIFIAFGIVWPVLLNTIRGVRSVPALQIETGRVFGVGRTRRLLQIVLPAAAPQIFAGLRVALSLALVLMVISEMVAASGGIGFEILQGQASFDFPGMWAGIVVVGVVGVLLNALLSAVEHFALGWHRGARMAAQ
jgi:ABC-type nitrate/sulfonate/bicarbonate transport system permease component